MLHRVLQKDLKTSGWPFISGSGVNIIKWKSVSEHFSRVMLHMFAIEKWYPNLMIEQAIMFQLVVGK